MQAMNVGLVIVSHSAKLAEGVVELAGQMIQGRARLIAAGGDNSGGLGTSVERIGAAIQAADSGAGVVVLIDLGSALLSTEFALEILSDEQRQRVVISAAPLVEGAVVAAVEASVGGDLATVARAAQGALATPKVPLVAAEAAPVAPPSEQARSATVVLLNRVGLHARPASLFVQTSNRYRATVSVALGTHQADGRRILSLLQLGARSGDTLVLRAEGEDAQAALDALVALVRAKFGEDA